MVPNVSKAGHSFAGAMRYYMHDKRPDGETGPHPSTSERVAWTETRNLAGAGPHTATRIMIDHAQQADELKRAAGIKATGRKSRAHVYAFSLSWAEGEVDGLDRAEMLRATEQALKFLGADHLQAVIIAHHDTAHPHVHVVLNRVQADGRMWNPSNDFPKFSEWANRYERENGKIVTPARDEKMRQIEEARAEQAQQKVADRQEQAAQKPRQESDQAKPKPPSPGRILKERADAQKARHRAEWKALGDDARRERQAIYRQADIARRDAELAFKGATKKDWAQHFRDERTRVQKFETRERSLGGIIRNAFDAARAQAARKPEQTGVFPAALSNLLSAASRREAFAMVAESRAAHMRELMRQQKAQALASVDTAKRAALETHSKRVADSRAALIERQGAESVAMREAWRQHYAQKAAQAPGPSYRRRKAEPLRPRDPRPVPRQTVPTAERLAPATQSPSRQAAPAFARAGAWLQSRTAEAVNAARHVTAEIAQQKPEIHPAQYVRAALTKAEAAITQIRTAVETPPVKDHPPQIPSMPRRAADPAPEREQMARPPRTWEQLQEDRAIMSGAQPTNTENMRRRDEDAAAASPTPRASWIEKYQRAAQQEAAPPAPAPRASWIDRYRAAAEQKADTPQPKPHGPRMKP